MSKERRDTKIQQQREKDSERQSGGPRGGSSRIHDPMAPGSSNNVDDEDTFSNQRVKVCLLFKYYLKMF